MQAPVASPMTRSTRKRLARSASTNSECPWHSKMAHGPHLRHRRRERAAPDCGRSAWLLSLSLVVRVASLAQSDPPMAVCYSVRCLRHGPPGPLLLDHLEQHRTFMRVRSLGTPLPTPQYDGRSEDRRRGCFGPPTTSVRQGPPSGCRAAWFNPRPTVDGVSLCQHTASWHPGPIATS